MDDLDEAAKVLEIAVNTGVDWGDAAKSTSEILKKYTDDLYAACPKDDDEYVCMAAINRKWQARSIRWTLSFNEKSSVVNLAIRNSLRRYVPEELCRRLDACSGPR